MTREEAKLNMLITVDSNIGTYVKVSNADKTIDDIYNDLESRVCENCEEFKISKGFSGVEFTCYKGYGCTNEYGNIFTERDFGCNEFKRKTKC